MAGGEVYPLRREFGRHVAETLSPHLASRAVRHVRDRVESIAIEASGWRLRDENAPTLLADLTVIATTHSAPTCCHR